MRLLILYRELIVLSSLESVFCNLWFVEASGVGVVKTILGFPYITMIQWQQARLDEKVIPSNLTVLPT